MIKPKNEYRPDYVSPPGATLEEAYLERGMTQVDFAQRIGLTRKHVGEIVKGTAPITTDTALKFERVLGIPARFWNNREQQYRDFLARKAENEELQSMKDWLKHFRHLPTMKKFGWIPEVQAPVDVLRALLEFFGVASPNVWQVRWKAVGVRYRRSKTYEPDTFALAAWLRRGELQAQQLNCAPYNEAKFRAALRKARALTQEDPDVFHPRLVELCAAAGVAVVFVPELPKTASGATRWLSPTKALIQLSIKYKTDDHLWFTFFHEAGHILLHAKKDIFIETSAGGSKEEEQADRFAARSLISESDFEAFVASHSSKSKTAIERFARQQGIAPGIVVGQLQHVGRIPFHFGNDLKRRFEWRIEQSEDKTS